MSLVSSNCTNKRSANQIDIVNMETTSTNTKTRKPLGNLSYFPPEIRDEIYRYVLFRKYKAFYSSSVIRPTIFQKTNLQIVDIPVYHDWTTYNLSILRLPKAIKDEAMPIFYLEGTFRFYYSPRLGQSYFEEVLQISNLDMTNIEIIYDAQIKPSCFHFRDRIGYLWWRPSGSVGILPRISCLEKFHQHCVEMVRMGGVLRHRDDKIASIQITQRGDRFQKHDTKTHHQ